MRKIFLFLAAAIGVALAPVTAHGLAGYLWETDFSSGSVFQFKPTGEKIPFRTGLTGVRGIAFDHSGNLFLGFDEKILRITPGGSTTVFASNLHGPDFLATDRTGNLYASDRDGNVVRFTPLGAKSNFVTGLDKPTGLAFDAFGNLFVADYARNAIYKITPAGAKSTFATSLSGPQGLAFDRLGNLYVANPGTRTVEVFNRLGSRFTSVYTVNSPVGITFDASDNFFVADNCNGTGTNTIYKFTPGVQTGEVFASGLGCPLQLAIEPARDPLLNISTRARVETGPDQELIAGFIITGTAAKTVLLRAIGPSLQKSGVIDPLPDPILELHTSEGTVTNNDWVESQREEIESTGLAPKDGRESAILVSLDPGSYTAIVRGHEEAPSGIAVVEVYDANLSSNSTLANISTRAFVQTGNNVMIGGFVIGAGNGAGKVIVRALGPTLAEAGVRNVLRDPSLELHNENGSIMRSNDDWADDQPTEIYATGIPPTGSLESAIVANLPSGQYTAIVRGLTEQGLSGATGVGLIEIYNLR